MCRCSMKRAGARIVLGCVSNVWYLRFLVEEIVGVRSFVSLWVLEPKAVS